MVGRMWLGRELGEALKGRFWDGRRKITHLIETENANRVWKLEMKRSGKKYMLGSLETHKFNHIPLDH